MDCKHGQHVSFCPDLPAIWFPNYYGEKKRNPGMDSKPTEEERRQAEQEAFIAGKRMSAPDKHAHDCECWKCKPGEWT